MEIKKGDHVIVTTIPSGRVEGATVNWAHDEETGVTYDTGGGNVLPLLPHADNAEIYHVALDKSIRSRHTPYGGRERQ
jgi:hypothetical protein